MRRAWLLALLLLPAVAAAQTAPTPGVGQVTFPTVPLSSTDEFINAAECTGTGTVALSWRVSFESGKSFADVASYQLFATNDKHSPTATGACPTTPDTTTGLEAGPVGSAVDTDLLETMSDVEYLTSAIVAAAGKGACNSSANEDITLCVQAKDSGNGNVGAARGKLILSRTASGAPTGVSASPGDGALNVSWSTPSGSPAAESYLVEATVVGTTAGATDPTSVHRSGRLTTTSFRLEGLVNTVVYGVVVYAFTPADNQSVASSPRKDAMPQQVDDFWDEYKDLGGRELGGCAGGPAGLASLAVAAGLLAVLRRRK